MTKDKQGTRLCLRAAARLVLIMSALVPNSIRAQQPADSAQAAAVESVITKCRAGDAVDTPKDRLDCWESAQRVAPNDTRVFDGLLDAKRAVNDAEKAVLSQVQKSKTSHDSVETLLARANTDLANGSVDGADTYVTRVLVMDPGSVDALTLRERISTARKWQARKTLLMAVGAVVVVFSLALIAIVRRLAAKRDESSWKPAIATSPSRIALRIVDGLGRGRMYTIDADAFRIGAAESDRVEERNDLVLSDPDARISRFHCALLKRKQRWTIVDSSMNGTWVNDRRLERGAPVPLRDGDEITIAGVSRLTFITL